MLPLGARVGFFKEGEGGGGWVSHDVTPKVLYLFTFSC